MHGENWNAYKASKGARDQNTMSGEERFNASLKAGDPLELEINGVKAVFRYCLPGTFLMGSPEDKGHRHDDETQHEATLTQGFWLLETPVTQALWKAVMGENPSRFQGLNARPVESVSWNDCVELISKLNVAGSAPKGWAFDFPTEAKWEYACRAGTTTRFNVGDELTQDDANFDSIFRETTPVKSYAPNAWGFYDMHGNVWEWCKDWHGSYSSNAVTDPQGSSSGSNRVLRGGSWISSARSCRSAYRRINDPSYRHYYFGFRLALRSVD